MKNLLIILSLFFLFMSYSTNDAIAVEHCWGREKLAWGVEASASNATGDRAEIRTRIIDVTDYFTADDFGVVYNHILSHEVFEYLGNAFPPLPFAIITDYGVWLLGSCRDGGICGNGYDVIFILDTFDQRVVGHQYYEIVYFHPEKDIDYVKKYNWNTDVWEYEGYEKGHLYLVVSYCDSAISNDLIMDNFKIYTDGILSFIAEN